MKQPVRPWSGLVLGTVVLLSTGVNVDRAAAERETDSPRAKVKLNKCGCYRDGQDICMCVRQSSCGCPGECEPVGCEEKRQKDLARRMDEELKRVREAESQNDNEKGDAQPLDGTKPRQPPEEEERKGQRRENDREEERNPSRNGSRSELHRERSMAPGPRPLERSDLEDTVDTIEWSHLAIRPRPIAATT